VVFNAGRGWYSSLAKPTTLESERVATLVQELTKAFPSVGFLCIGSAAATAPKPADQELPGFEH
jgi:hypothetical protein